MNIFEEKQKKFDEFDEQVLSDLNDELNIFNRYHYKSLKEVAKQQINTNEKDNGQVEVNDRFEDQDQQKFLSDPIRRIYYKHSTIPPLIEDMEGMKSFDMNNYFVNLKTVIKDNNEQIGFDEVGGEKISIDIDDIFNSDEQNLGLKILILGGAGVGKSTLMQYMAYKWSSNDIWQNKFDAVFRVQLKTLLTNNWKQRYLINPTYSLEIEKNPLKYLIHYNLISISEQNKQACQLQVEDIDLNQSNVALLLDGYDEVTHLFEDPTFSKIQEFIFQQKYVILTSRPNAITDQFKKKFNLIIENTGLDKQGISQYINQYFVMEEKQSQKKLRLEELLEGSQSIQSICHIPVNLAMLCYLYSEQQEDISSLTFHSPFQLYKEVIKKLGERFISKDFKGVHSERQTLKEKVSSQLKKLPELRTLRYIAYMGLTGGGIDIEESNRKETLIINTYQDRKSKNCASIEESIDNQNLQTNANKIIKFGLLKQEGPTNDNTSYSFIHLSFQEYLTAEFLMQKLIFGRENEKNNVLHYLSQHRNEPRLLLTLKFMSGLVSEQDNKVVVEQFWSSMNCNVNGVLEFSLQEKVKLLMSLLGSANRINENNHIQIDKRIPHINEINILINAVVISNLTEFRQQLKDSNFNSQIIISAIESLLQGGDCRLELLQSIKGLFFQNSKSNGCFQWLEIHKNRILQEIIQYIYEDTQQLKIQVQQQSKTQIENDEDLQADRFNNQQQGLNIIWYFPQKINQEILLNSILSILESDSYIESFKYQALSIINLLLENYKINDYFSQKIFQFIMNFEINYQKSILEKSEKYPKEKLLSIQAKQDEPKSCLFCQLDQGDEKIFYKEQEGLYEIMFSILRHLSSINLRYALNWIKKVIIYQLHYQRKWLPQIFQFIKQLLSDRRKIKQSEEQIENIKFLIGVLVFHLDIIDNFHSIWREFNQQMKDLLVDNLISNLNGKQINQNYFANLILIFKSIKDELFLQNLVKQIITNSNYKIFEDYLLRMTEYLKDSFLIQEIYKKKIDKQIDLMGNTTKYMIQISVNIINKLQNVQDKEERLEQAINIYISSISKAQNQSGFYKHSFSFLFAIRVINQIDNFKKNLLYSFIIHILHNSPFKYTRTDLSIDKIFELLEKNQQGLEKYFESLFLQDGRFPFRTIAWFIQIILIQDNLSLLQFYRYFLNTFFNYYFANENKIKQLDQEDLFFQICIFKINTLELELIDILSIFFKMDIIALSIKRGMIYTFQEHLVIIVQKFLVCQFEKEERNSYIDNDDEARKLIKILKNSFFDKNEADSTLKSMVRIKYLTFLVLNCKKLNKNEEFNQEITLKKLSILTKYLILYFEFINIKIDEDNQVEHTLIQQIIEKYFQILSEQPQLFDSIISSIDQIVQSIQNNQYKSSISFKIFQLLEYLIKKNMIESKRILELKVLQNIQQDEFKSGMILLIQQLISQRSNIDQDYLFNSLSKILSHIQSFKNANNYNEFVIFFQQQLLQDQSQLLNQISLMIEDNRYQLQDRMLMVSRLTYLFTDRKLDHQISNFLEEKCMLMMNKIKEDINLFLEIPYSYIGSLLTINKTLTILEFIINYLNYFIEYYSCNYNEKIKLLFKYFKEEENRNEEQNQIILRSIFQKLQEIIEQNSDVKIKQNALHQIKDLMEMLKKDEQSSNLMKLLIQTMLKQSDEDLLNFFYSGIMCIAINFIPEEEHNKIKSESQPILELLLKRDDFNIFSYLQLQIDNQKRFAKFKELVLNEHIIQKEFKLIEIFQIMKIAYCPHQKEIVDFTFNETSPNILQEFKKYYQRLLGGLNRQFVFASLIQKYKRNVLTQKQLIEEFKFQQQKLSPMYNHLVGQSEQEIITFLEGLKQTMFRFYKQDIVLDITLNIISLENEEISSRKELIQEAKILLKNIVDNIEENELSWIMKNIQYLSKVSNYSKLLFTKVIETLLKDSILSDNSDQAEGINEFRVLIDLISCNANIQFNNKGYLIIEGRRFKLQLDDNSKILLDKELSKMMRNHKNPFITQYIKYQPLFQNQSEQLISCSDIQDYSVVDSDWNKNLNREQMTLDTHWKLIELISFDGDKIVFFEKRDIFGQRNICKLITENKTAKIFDNNLKNIFGKYNGPQMFYGQILNNPYLLKGQKGLSIECFNWDDIQNDNEFIKCYQQLDGFRQYYTDYSTFEVYHDALLNLEITSNRMQDIVFFEFTKTLKDYEAILKHEIQKQFGSDKKLQKNFIEYYRGFVKTFSLCFTEAQVISSGKFEYDKQNTGLNVACKLISFIPLVGEIGSSVVQSVGEFLIDRNIKRNANALLNFANDHTDLSQKCGKLALLIIKKYKNEIFTSEGFIEIFRNKKNPKIQANTSEEKKVSIIDKLKEKVNALVSKIESIQQQVDSYLYNNLYRGEYEMLGNEDATQLIQIICKNILLDEKDPNDDFEKIKKELQFNFQESNVIIPNQNIQKNEKTSCKCSIF